MQRSLDLNSLKPRARTAETETMEASAGAPRPETGDERHICCTMTSVLLRTIRSARGDTGVNAVLEAAGSRRDVAFLQNTDNWVALDEAVALLEAGVKVSGDPDFARRAGAETVRQHAGTQVATLLRSLGSPEAVLAGITTTAAKFSAVTDMEAIETGPGHAVVRAVARPGFERSRLHCDWARGLLSTPCELFGLPPARVEETECQARGGSECRYSVSWDRELAEAAADPEHRTRALEAQLTAMSERLESAYATASDLVSPDDLETVLARIVERAANAVRAPSYVLAVRVESDGEVHVFSDGVAPGEAQRIATLVLSSEEPGDTMLCVDVASSRRDYGRLVAIHPAGMSFFPQERQLLALYGKHAAAVLDTAVALREASRRHDNVSALLSLSRALARAGTTEEVAGNLTAAVVDVIDCDVATMWVWDEDAGRVCRKGGSSDSADGRREAIGLRDTPYLKRMVSDPRPMFFGQEVDDPYLEAIMKEAHLVGLAVVPIIARDVFLGLLTVGIEHGPQRLCSSPELLEKLIGVAALAAPALQNGRLIDELGRQVVHDSLTGVLNRTGFGRSVEAVLADAMDRRARAGLLFVDLDGFKLLNDAHGHQVGDDLLREVAERLRGALRGEDTVARLGGDEFAVVLPRVTRPGEVHAAALRVHAAFAEPFTVAGLTMQISASVGEAISPDHGTSIDDLVRHADAAMYREKAQRGVLAQSSASTSAATASPERTAPSA
jgi:diguanylate cyclase (GGDEF)-like protein